MSGSAETYTFTAIFQIRQVETRGTDGVLHKVPPGIADVVVFDVNAVTGPDPSSAIQADNRNMATLNQVMAAWSAQFSVASNELIRSLERRSTAGGTGQSGDPPRDCEVY